MKGNMFKITALLFLILSLLSRQGYSQITAASYAFARTSGTFASISATGTAITTSGTGVLADDGNTTGIPIGFTFKFCGTNYTTCAANSNPVLSLQSTGTAICCGITTSNILGGGWLMPMWTDGDGRTGGGGTPRVYYQTTGRPGGRVFTIEWADFGVYPETADHMNWQIKLYEGANVVQFVYGPFTASPSGIIGIANSKSDFQTLPYATATATSPAFNTDVSLPANGTILTFTPPHPPSVTTAMPANTASTSAMLGGNVTADGGAAVTERGIVWSTSANPTTADNKVVNGSGTGTFSATVGGLPAGTTIHVQAYAINSLGTSYGGDLSFTTLAAEAGRQVTNLSGTSVAGGIGVTVSSSGGVTSFSPCGAATAPYYFTGGAGSFTFNFSAPVGSVEVDALFASAGTPGQVHFVRNGVAYAITDANLAGATASTCGDGTLALAQNGDLVNPPGDYAGTPNNRVIIPGPITSLTVSNVAANGAVFGLFLTPETYFQVVNTTGISTVNGVGVTVGSSGGVTSFSPCGPNTSPYYLTGGAGGYTFTFGAAVDAVEADTLFASGGTPGQVHFVTNGAADTLTAANLAGVTVGTCGDATPAQVQGGDLVNPPGDYAGTPNNRVIIPGPVTSLTVSNMAANGGLFGLYFTKGNNAALTFTNTSNQNLAVALNAPATPIDALLAVTGQNPGLPLKWTLGVAPLHGVVVGGGSVTSTGGNVTTTGSTYQPAAGYSGVDGFTIYVSDGVNTVATTVLVSVGLPTVTTLAATLVGPTNATLNGSVNPNGLSTGAWFQYGTTTNYGSTTSASSAGSGLAPLQANVLITTLSPGTLYHFCFVGTNNAGTNFGSDLTFTTVAILPPLLNHVTATNNQLRFAFTNAVGQTFTVLTATNVTLPLSNWLELSSPIEGPAGQYQFIDPQMTTNAQRFYRVRWP